MQSGWKWGRHPACQFKHCRLEACTTQSAWLHCTTYAEVNRTWNASLPNSLPDQCSQYTTQLSFVKNFFSAATYYPYLPQSTIDTSPCFMWAHGFRLSILFARFARLSHFLARIPCGDVFVLSSPPQAKLNGQDERFWASQPPMSCTDAR